MQKSFFTTLVFLAFCSAINVVCANDKPASDAQQADTAQSSSELLEQDNLDKLDQQTRDLLIKKAVWVETFRAAQVGKVSIEAFVYATLELMKELGKSTNQDDKEMYDLCEKIVKNITDALNAIADQEESSQDATVQ